MTTNTDDVSPEPTTAEKMIAALCEAESVIDDVTDEMYYEDGQPVTFLESSQIERIYLDLCGLIVQLNEAVDEGGAAKLVLSAAPELLAALDQAVKALNTAPRFHVPVLGTDSYKIAALCDRAIAKAKGGAQ